MMGQAEPFSVLRRLVQQAAAPPEPQLTACELCSEAISESHRHLLEVASRAVLCVCYPCSLLFDNPVASEGRYKLISERRLLLQDFQMDEPDWARLQIPVGMAFLFYSTPEEKVVAYYPSPMGPTESLVRQERWAALVAHNPILAEMAADVEALLINRLGEEPDYFLVPIDDCYRLVGLLRARWKGLSGGEALWQALDDFFATLRTQARPR